jgi:two-component sensor histidine kinase
MTGCASSADKPVDRSLLYVTELVHRVQNEYAKAISLASIIAATSSNPEAKAALRQVRDHLYAAAETHRVLRPPQPGGLVDFAADLTQLCRAMASAGLDQRGIALHLTISGPVLLDAVRCWRANLILSELITNASRHAFGGGGGRISVGVTTACGWVGCRISDDGNAAPTPKPGLGSRLVDALAADLEGSVGRRYTKSGAIITLTFPKCLRSADSSNREDQRLILGGCSRLPDCGGIWRCA